MEYPQYILQIHPTIVHQKTNCKIPINKCLEFDYTFYFAMNVEAKIVPIPEKTIFIMNHIKPVFLLSVKGIVLTN